MLREQLKEWAKAIVQLPAYFRPAIEGKSVCISF